MRIGNHMTTFLFFCIFSRFIILQLTALHQVEIPSNSSAEWKVYGKMHVDPKKCGFLTVVVALASVTLIIAAQRQLSLAGRELIWWMICLEVDVVLWLGIRRRSIRKQNTSKEKINGEARQLTTAKIRVRGRMWLRYSVMRLNLLSLLVFVPLSLFTRFHRAKRSWLPKYLRLHR